MSWSLLGGRDGGARAQAVEAGADFARRRRREEAGDERVVRKPAARRVKDVAAHAERGDESVEARDLDVGDGGQLVEIAVPGSGVAQRQEATRPPGRQHPGAEGSIGGDHRVMGQRVDRIVGGADRENVALLDQRARREATTKNLGTPLPHLVGGLGAEQQVVDVEIPRQFQVAPVVERVAQQVRHDAGEGVELLAIGGVSRAVALGDAVGAHLAPLVVIAVEPHLADVVPAAVGGDLRRRQMGVVVDDRLRGGVVMVEADRLVALQQEPLVNQAAHEEASLPRVG